MRGARRVKGPFVTGKKKLQHWPYQRRSFNPYPNVHVHNFTKDVAGAGAHMVFSVGVGGGAECEVTPLVSSASACEMQRLTRHVNCMHACWPTSNSACTTVCIRRFVSLLGLAHFWGLSDCTSLRIHANYHSQYIDDMQRANAQENVR